MMYEIEYSPKKSGEYLVAIKNEDGTYKYSIEKYHNDISKLDKTKSKIGSFYKYENEKYVFFDVYGWMPIPKLPTKKDDILPGQMNLFDFIDTI